MKRMHRAHQRIVAIGALLAVSGIAPALHSDTVFLKNGSLIDGVITHRTEESVLLQIGDIGKLEILKENIYLIEKNKRKGGELLKNSLDTKGKVELFEKEKSKLDRKGEGDEFDELDELDMGDEPIVGEEEESKIDPELEKRIEQLIKDLDRQKRRYRVRAERHLKAIGRPSIPYLLPLAENSRDLTRISVMRLFYAFGDESVIEACIGALSDVNEYVRDYANKTLVRVTGEDFGFVAQSTPRRRELSQKKWQKWWEEEEEALREVRNSARRVSAESR